MGNVQLSEDCLYQLDCLAQFFKILHLIFAQPWTWLEFAWVGGEDDAQDGEVGTELEKLSAANQASAFSQKWVH